MNSCKITRLWPSVEDMKKDLFIDLQKQEITRLSTGHKYKFKTSNKGYYMITFSKGTKNQNYFLVHRLFFYYHYGYIPKIVDHKDTNRKNNNIENLRELNTSQSSRNTKKRKNSTSIYKGVNWSKIANKWVAHLSLNKKDIHIAYFDNEDDAGQAYNDKIRELGLEEVSVMNDTPQERARKNTQFDPLPPEMNHIRDLFLNIEPLVDFK
jgi:hypothetical protein